jgi:uncharacterized protein YjbI with pentapeptide repeats
MTNKKQLDILKQGAMVWNKWREKNPNVAIDLSDADLEGADLRIADLSGATLFRADLYGAHLFGVDLRIADLRGADLSGADLSGAALFRADLSGANLRAAGLRDAGLEGANLRAAGLRDAKLSHAGLEGANLSGADLSGANLHDANLSDADLSGAILLYTILGAVDLRTVKGLETVNHQGPSTIGIDTIYRSQGNISETFLKGAGVPDSFIEYMRSLVNNPIDYYSCFISYSSKNEDFAKRLYADLQSNHVRCWFAPEDMKIGAKIRPSIDESIRLHDKLLLILSQHSVASQWIEQEVERALARERKEEKVILFPIRLDQTVMDIEEGWPALVRNTRNIGDFTRWKRHDAYEKAFTRLLRDLKTQ